ncbi:hypothetical protein JOF47_000165 [Paeniglutamicibacter kerguelensis]|uniref:Uncharacterized protein n=1 Tax=Paeniglutamicibacter kerguelensis TaxID=254788 RepID=A0ABS4XAD9_9MICC|nr:hypothetical protein [Paeniglutamicibacter kerguelensis]
MAFSVAKAMIALNKHFSLDVYVPLGNFTFEGREFLPVLLMLERKDNP